MIRTTIRRAGLLVATTALAGAVFAGTAAAGGDDATGVGGDGGKSQNNCGSVNLNLLGNLAGGAGNTGPSCDTDNSGGSGQGIN